MRVIKVEDCSVCPFMRGCRGFSGCKWDHWHGAPSTFWVKGGQQAGSDPQQVQRRPLEAQDTFKSHGAQPSVETFQSPQRWWQPSGPRAPKQCFTEHRLMRLVWRSEKCEKHTSTGEGRVSCSGCLARAGSSTNQGMWKARRCW